MKRMKNPEMEREIARVLPRVRRLRQTLHACPEIAFREFQTRRTLLAALAGTPLVFRKPYLGTDIVADLSVPGAPTTVCLRADMDALPMTEETGVRYASRNPGFMHACGHDGHSAMLAGAVLVLSRLRARLRANVRFVFQPGEETECGGGRLVGAGALAGVDEAYALHGWHGYPVGTVVSRKGPFLAANAGFAIEVCGKGTHGAMPEAGRNPIPVASELVLELETLHARMQRTCGAVVSVCSVSAGSNTNIIPGRALLRGTTRYFDARTGNRIRDAMAGIVSSVSRRRRIKIVFRYDSKYDVPVVNTGAGVERVKAATRAAGGRFLALKSALMVSEDFAFYLPKREGALFLLGLGSRSPALHTPEFDFNDAALQHGIRMFANLLVR